MFQLKLKKEELQLTGFRGIVFWEFDPGEKEEGKYQSGQHLISKATNSSINWPSSERPYDHSEDAVLSRGLKREEVLLVSLSFGENVLPTGSITPLKLLGITEGIVKAERHSQASLHKSSWIQHDGPCTCGTNRDQGSYTSSLCCLADYPPKYNPLKQAFTASQLLGLKFRCGLPGYLWLKLPLLSGWSPLIQSSLWGRTHFQVLQVVWQGSGSSRSRIHFPSLASPEAPQISATGLSTEQLPTWQSLPPEEGVRGAPN